jgi:LCP family protein required for cell wall assembly
VVLAGGLAFGGYWVHKTYSTLEDIGIDVSPTETLGTLINKKEPELKKDENNLTSALAVGIDTRDSNPGLRNTDSIIVITLNHDTDEVTMLSLPRDLWVEKPNNPGYYAKINSVYSTCENIQEGTGMDCLVDTAQEITGLKIQYHGMIDIGGFVKVIDTLGGVEVDVENSFTDYMFPTPQNTYETISFQSGLQQMDGERAMKFARSRHAQSVEGSDFARARRQQKVIIAAKRKLLSTETLLDPKKISQLMDDLGGSVKISGIDSTNDIQAGLNKLQKIEQGGIYSMVLDPMAGNWSLITEAESSYALIPQAGLGNWTVINEFVQDYIDKPAIYDEQAKIYVYNGGLGYSATNQEVIELQESYPFLNIVFGGNVLPQTYTGTNIYSFSQENKYATLSALENYFDAEWSEEIPDGVTAPYAEDIKIILGSPPVEEVESEETQDSNQDSQAPSEE